MRFRRGRAFDDLVERQLALFAADEAALLAEADAAEAAWIRAGREGAEEAYGDYQLVVDAIADRLLDLREAYSSTLADKNADAYRRAFATVVRRRLGRYASLVSGVESS